ncbi:rhodanese-like domain-containing protein [Sinorhizobium numidicum]|uniref:Rhodanese-like domain-containing protein n=1 Tax=Sinorhizobium numidicum TaxID=680248 RepID=A0ABY8CR06_9HYPH|nr:rhodanese-like domain-containing protein [Sinorhizobium numidicum]WEX75097.1 rhodanese-like domain-containing protein [Sinorhizobium numidicum]WEX81091.1 rhodanese-like domain-containing protein [Sinorhizobium numidicum]
MKFIGGEIRRRLFGFILGCLYSTLCGLLAFLDSQNGGGRKCYLVDVRDTPEFQASGKVSGALHVPRGMLEFRADAETPYHDEAFSKDRPIILYCASDGRSALSGKTLKDLGYERVYNPGALKDWSESGAKPNPSDI